MAGSLREIEFRDMKGLSHSACLEGNQPLSHQSNLLCLLFSWHLFPSSCLCGFQHRIADVLRFEGIAEGGAGRFALGDAFEEIGDLMDERVFVADLQTGHPPFSHVWMISIRDMDRAPAADPAFIFVFEELQAMQVVQIPKDRGVFAVDLKRV